MAHASETIMNREHMIRMRLVEMFDGLLARYENRLLPETTVDVVVSNPEPQELADLIQVLLRVDSGRFGLCEECGEAISYQRLIESPTVVVCADCSENEAWRPSP